MRQFVRFASLTIVAFTCTLCRSTTEGKFQIPPNGVPFFTVEKRAIILPVHLEDNITANLLFDTGTNWDYIMLDSTFCANNFHSAWSSEPDLVYDSHVTAWHPSDSPKKRREYYNTPLKAKLSGTDLHYTCFRILDTKGAGFSSDENVDGLFGFPINDTTHVWELNFKHNYLEIHRAESFDMPQDCYVTEFEKEGPNSIDISIPMTVTFDDGQKLTTNNIYTMDTGMVMDFVLTPHIDEFDFYDERNDAILLHNHLGGFQSRYIAHATVFGNFEIDILRIYTEVHADNLNCARLVGLNFLKRFNLFFDFSTGRLGLQPVNNFSRIVDHSIRRYYWQSVFNEDGRQFVGSIPDTENNPYKEAGLREGDEIVSVNGYGIKSMTEEAAAEIRASDVKQMELIRDGEPQSITVYTDDSKYTGE